MSLRRSLAGIAAVAAFIASAIVGMPVANAATQTVSVNCLANTAQSLTVASGEQVIFDLSNVPCINMFRLGNPPLSSDTEAATASLQGLIDGLVDLSGTGGSVVAYANVTENDITVTYTAGPNAGTDVVTIELPVFPGFRRLVPRGVGPEPTYGVNSYSLTVPDTSTPPPWFQSYGRGAAESCTAGWNPSWAEWPNNHTGGFVCVRNVVYNNATGAWDARRLR